MSQLWSSPRCDHVERKGNHRVVCDAEVAAPQFTMRLRDMRKGDKQPRFFCEKHGRKHHNLSPITGRRINAT